MDKKFKRVFLLVLVISVVICGYIFFRDNINEAFSNIVKEIDNKDTPQTCEPTTPKATETPQTTSSAVNTTGNTTTGETPESSGSETTASQSDTVPTSAGTTIIHSETSVQGNSTESSTSTEEIPFETGAEYAETTGVLEEFYSFAAKVDDYPKAMELLTDDFTLELSMLKAFGFEKLTKAQFTDKNLSQVSAIITTATLDKISRYEESENAWLVYYRQTMKSGETSVKLDLCAKIVLENGVYKLANIKDAIAEPAN